MTTQERDRIESAIRHIQTSVDIDPWAMEIAVKAMTKQMEDLKNSPTQMSETSDLIRRQDALDCFHAWMDSRGDAHEPDEMPEYRAIEALPSAIPEEAE